MLSIHWGSNWGFEILPEQRLFAHRLVEVAGIDVVHGHSSHHVKGIGIHCDRPILYGCQAETPFIMDGLVGTELATTAAETPREASRRDRGS